MPDLAERLRTFIESGAEPIGLDEIVLARIDEANEGRQRRLRSRAAHKHRRRVAGVAAVLIAVTAVVSGLLISRSTSPTVSTAPRSRSAQIQAVTRFPLPQQNHDPTAVTRGPDSDLWFTTANIQPQNGFVDRVTPEGNVTPIPIPGGQYGAGITVGPDHNIWIADLSGQIERINPRNPNQVTTYPLSNGERAHDITVGPDGNLWFTESFTPEARATDFGARIGRITPNGVITEFTVPGEPSEPNAIIRGTDGALWFTDTLGRIGRVTTTGQFTFFQFPDVPAGGVVNPQFGLEPQGGDGLTTGPDGAVWFTTRQTIDRITPAGVISQFTVPSGVVPEDLIVGPDGALWFGSSSNSAVGSMTTTGTFQIFPLGPTDFLPTNFAFGSDNTLWVSGTDHVLRITISH